MSDALDSLPARPLRQREVTALNHADAFTLVVPVDREEAVEAETREPVVVTERLILGTDDWVKGLVYDGGWVVVESVAVDDPDEERFEAMRDCEAAVADYEA
ncbi:hypothetical protein [Halobacterium jilantaiense]|uniref:DUF7964 domain-containing protein n=1 Tax=Halobacterium jilantaiense TaxID=355548 RepID=A0A1I0NMK1_9EURY|nr:hypothetical protein [Halobacterium jilantaiense]SEW02694.1 hypothetical protein SAMN04487945_1003 [Halobacterium jilantaiense]